MARCWRNRPQENPSFWPRFAAVHRLRGRPAHLSQIDHDGPPSAARGAPVRRDDGKKLRRHAGTRMPLPYKFAARRSQFYPVSSQPARASHWPLGVPRALGATGAIPARGFRSLVAERNAVLGNGPAQPRRFGKRQRLGSKTPDSFQFSHCLVLWA